MKFIKAVLWSWIKVVHILWNAKFRADAEKLFRALSNKVQAPSCNKPKTLKTRHLVTLAILKPFNLDKWCATKKFGWEIEYGYCDNKGNDYHFHLEDNVVHPADYS